MLLLDYLRETRLFDKADLDFKIPGRFEPSFEFKRLGDSFSCTLPSPLGILSCVNRLLNRCPNFSIPKGRYVTCPGMTTTLLVRMHDQA